jgi:hypothetical protein
VPNVGALSVHAPAGVGVPNVGSRKKSGIMRPNPHSSTAR